MNEAKKPKMYCQVYLQVHHSYGWISSCGMIDWMSKSIIIMHKNYIQCSPRNSKTHIYHEFSVISKFVCVPAYT